MNPATDEELKASEPEHFTFRVDKSVHPNVIRITVPIESLINDNLGDALIVGMAFKFQQASLMALTAFRRQKQEQGGLIRTAKMPGGMGLQ